MHPIHPPPQICDFPSKTPSLEFTLRIEGWQFYNYRECVPKCDAAIPQDCRGVCDQVQ